MPTFETLKTPSFLPAVFDQLEETQEAAELARQMELGKREWRRSFTRKAAELLEYKRTTEKPGEQLHGGGRINGTWTTDPVTIGEGTDQMQLQLEGKQTRRWDWAPNEFRIFGSRGEIQHATLLFVTEGAAIDWNQQSVDTYEQRREAEALLNLFDSLPFR